MTKIATVAASVMLAIIAAPASAPAAEPSAGCGSTNLWTKACAPAATGTAPLEGVVHAASGFSYASISIVYRTTEGSLGPQAGIAQYGPWQTASTGPTGAFRLVLPACDAQATFGCVGTAYELYAAYHGEPCTEMWYADMYVNEPDRLPQDALACANPSETIVPLTGGGEGFEPECKPPTARNCLPGTAIIADAKGTVSHPEADKPFSLRDVRVVYRTIESGLRDAETIYGAPHDLKSNGGRTFSGTLASCGPIALLKLGCDGENIQAWSTYTNITCSPIIAVTSRVPSWDITCDTRGTIEGKLFASKPSTWRILLRDTRNGSTTGVSVKPNGEFVTKVMPGSYRATARRGKMQCVMHKSVIIGIASTHRLLLHC